MVLQSTPPHKGATIECIDLCAVCACASIHAPSQGGDRNGSQYGGKHRMLQSTPPHKGATLKCYDYVITFRLQSTPPHKGATNRIQVIRLNQILLQSTPPHKGATGIRRKQLLMSSCFNPRPLTRGRRNVADRKNYHLSASIHAPSQGGDRSRLRKQ